MQSHFSTAHSLAGALGLPAAAVPLIEQTEGFRKLTGATTPDVIYAALQAIGDTLTVRPTADQLVENLEERINIITHKLKFIAPENRPRVLLLHEVSPLIEVRSEYITNLVLTAGGVPVEMAVDGAHAEILILITDKQVPALLNDLPRLLSAEPWSQVPAVANDNVYIVHHPGYFRQPGALLADDAEILAEIIHPKYFIFGRDEDVWMRFNLR
jgi:hypothetical protein